MPAAREARCQVLDKLHPHVVLKTIIIVLNIFAGHRRYGDIEDCFAKCINGFSTVQCVVISVGNSLHDLLERRNLDSLLEHAYAGRVHGAFSADLARRGPALATGAWRAEVVLQSCGRIAGRGPSGS